MKKKKLLLFGLGLAIAGGAVTLIPAGEKSESLTAKESSYEEGEKEDFNGALEYYKSLRSNPTTGKVEIEEILKAQEGVKRALVRGGSTRSAVNITWNEMGPGNVGGRIRAVHFDKNNANTIYAGGVAGGLWKTTNGGQSWSKMFDQLDNVAVASMTQAANGDLYIGTGEGHYNQDGSGAGGILGQGVFKSTDGGSTWTQLPSTIPTTANSATVAWAAVNEMAADPTNSQRIYAATNKGLQISNDGGATWTGAFSLGIFFADVDVAKDGTVIATTRTNVYKSANGDPGTYESIIDNSNVAPFDSLPSGGARYEIALAPSDANYMYASIAGPDQKTKGIYRSTNKGVTWTVIGPGGSPTFNPLGSQGEYANAISVCPTDKDKILVGGLDLYMWSTTTTWTKLSRWFTWPGDPLYVHADIHDLKWHPTNGNQFYVGCDGGIFRSNDNGVSFYNKNQGLNITQFYGIAPGVMGDVMGGTQDNGTQYIPAQTGYGQIAYEVSGGDGGQTEMSYLNPEASFVTVYYGQLRRRPTYQSMSASDFYSKRIENLKINGQGVGEGFGFANFVTPIRMWESKNDTLSVDSVDFRAERSYTAGESIVVKSKVPNNNFTATTPVALDSGDVLRVKDPVQARFVVGFNGQIYMTKGALDFSSNPGWARIAGAGVSAPNAFTGIVQSFAFSPDGDHLFVGTTTGTLWRISNLHTFTNSDTLTGELGNVKCQLTCTRIGSFGGQTLTSIGVDPRNGNNIIVTLGNYARTNYVYRGTNALTMPSSTNTTNFTLVQGTTNGLPAMPVYAAVVDYQTGTVLLGTEYGVWSSDDVWTSSDPTWVSQNATFPLVPVFSMRQQIYADWNVSNTGVIYAGTHGRGIFKTASLVGVRETANAVSSAVQLSVYPNPAVETVSIAFTPKKKGDVTIRIYSLKGELVKQEVIKSIDGKNIRTFDAAELSNGTYLVKLSGAAEGSSKFVVIK